MMHRCYDPNHIGYSDYGGRGITVCEEWHQRRKFIEWALTNGYEPHLTIERKDNDAGYGPDNCRFASPKEQARNRSSNILLTAFGETKTIVEWSEDPRCTVCYIALAARVRSGGDPERIITTPSGSYHKTRKVPVYEAYGQKKPMREWVAQYGVKRTTIEARVRVQGRTFEEALAMGPPIHK